MNRANKTTSESIETPEALYHLFCALSQDERFTAARYILEEEEIRNHFKIPNEATLAAFSKDKAHMPTFNTIDALRGDLLA